MNRGSQQPNPASPLGVIVQYLQTQCLQGHNRTYVLSAGFLHLGSLDIWGQLSPYLLWGCPVHCRMHSSISGLYPLMPVVSLPGCETHIVSRHCQMLSGAKSHWLKTSRVYSGCMWCARKGCGYSRLNYSSALPLGKLWDFSAPVSSPVNGGNTKSKYDEEMK